MHGDRTTAPSPDRDLDPNPDLLYLLQDCTEIVQPVQAQQFAAITTTTAAVASLLTAVPSGMLSYKIGSAWCVILASVFFAATLGYLPFVERSVYLVVTSAISAIATQLYVVVDTALVVQMAPTSERIARDLAAGNAAQSLGGLLMSGYAAAICGLLPTTNRDPNPNPDPDPNPKANPNPGMLLRSLASFQQPACTSQTVHATTTRAGPVPGDTPSPTKSHCPHHPRSPLRASPTLCISTLW